MSEKVKQITKDFYKCFISGFTISVIIGMVAIMIGVMSGEKSFDGLFINIRSALLFTGAIVLFIGAFMWLKNTFTKYQTGNSNLGNVDDKQIIRSDRSYEKEFYIKSNATSVLRDKFYVFNYQHIFLCVALVIIVIGCIWDWMSYVII